MMGSANPQEMMSDATRLGDIAEVFAGVGVSREEAVQRDGEQLPMIGVRDLVDDAVSPIEALDTVGFDKPQRAENYRVQTGDILLTGRGTAMKFGLVGPETEGAVASSNIIVVRPAFGVVGAALYALLSSEAYRPKIELLRRGSTTLLSLSAKDLKRLELNLPPLEEQHRIAAIMLETRDAYRNAIRAAELRRDLARQLMNQRLFGEKN
ncbi:restriction endonuclease subunit S [Roseibium sediminicola]|uniref:Restriction endonuclease subunit S n=1 Tax=Roseibium sediminicola TaxID=2933272 RepID=A0ABT0GSY8_9HYPH|nr:restriction endonuclease subunit S [Roseibium sp. CAU 1639]MCK7612360.1 restriction endonuclease subunit S [Roseibium sp. CAU 1639]